jgi:hypothetical protein
MSSRDQSPIPEGKPESCRGRRQPRDTCGGAWLPPILDRGEARFFSNENTPPKPDRMSSITIISPSSGSREVPLPEDPNRRKLSAILEFLGGSYSDSSTYWLQTSNPRQIDRNYICQPGDNIACHAKAVAG